MLDNLSSVNGNSERVSTASCVLLYSLSFFCYLLFLSLFVSVIFFSIYCCLPRPSYAHQPVSLLLIKWPRPERKDLEFVQMRLPFTVSSKWNWPPFPFLHLQTRTESTSQSQVYLHDNLHATGNRVLAETWQWGRHTENLHIILIRHVSVLTANELYCRQQHWATKMFQMLLWKEKKNNFFYSPLDRDIQILWIQLFW